MATGEKIAARIGHAIENDSFNPVIVDFYKTIGFLPESLNNYLLLLGWSLDDSTEEFTREDMIKLFTLERVNKAPASFDPQKLSSFQTRWMNKLSLAEKVELCLPYLERANLLSNSAPESSSLPAAPEPRTIVAEIIEAAGDRIKIAGDILEHDYFFVPDDQVHYDEKAFNKRLRNDPQAAELLGRFREDLQELNPFDAASTEACLKEFIEREGIQFKHIIHALRVALTGKPVGFGMYETLAILGQPRSLARIDRALSQLSPLQD